MQVKVHEAVQQQTCASRECSCDRGACYSTFRPAQIRQSAPVQRHDQAQTQRSSNNPRIRQQLQIVIMRMIDDQPVVKARITRLHHHERAETCPAPRMFAEDSRCVLINRIAQLLGQSFAFQLLKSPDCVAYSQPRAERPGG